MNGGQEVPINESPAFGVAFMTFEDDEKLLHYSITFTDVFLVGSETAAHFHAPVLFAITPVPGSPKNGSVVPLTGKQIGELR